jgi:hypothetical protein
MELRRNTVLLVLAILCQFVAFGQNPKMDKLEMWFEQGLYKKVFRKSTRLLDNPEYDFSSLPSYYKGLSLIQLSQNEHWLLRHPDALAEAKSLFLSVKSSPSGPAIINSHLFELSWLRDDMIAYASDLKRQGKKADFEEMQEMIDVFFEGIDLLEGATDVEIYNVDSSLVSVTNGALRDEVIQTAKKQLGVPYVWAGNSPDGFDCSGFTSYVMSKNGGELPRRAADQFNDSEKVKAKNVQPGDLVFFNNGSGVSHVGIVISKNGDPLVMIHSSSSKGIIITNVSESEYWTKRLHGFGTYIK